MKFNFRVSPNYRSPLSTQRIMLELTLAISVVLAYNVYFYFANVGSEYGWHAIYMILTAVLTSVAVEVLWALAFKKNVFKFLNTSFPWVTALLYVGMMGVNKPIYVIMVGTIVAIVIGKLIFGGFGQNIFNPAGVGRAFSVLSFGGFIVASFPDVITGATPNQVMEKLGWVIQDPAVVTKFLDQFGGLWGLSTGAYLGALGETNTILIVLVGIYLSVRGIIDWKVPVAFVTSLFVFTGVIALVTGMGIWYPVFHLVTGGAMFGAVFMMTDPVTTPTSITGRIIFAIGVALLVVVIRVKSNLPEGVIRSILFMNMMTPLIDRVTDGWAFKDFKKNLIKVGTVFAVGLVTVGFLGTIIHYIEPIVIEEPKVVINLGNPIKIMETNSETMTTIVSRTDEGTVSTFVIDSKGYAQLESDHVDPLPNQLEVKIDTATNTVVSVAYVTFSDTKSIGDKTNSEVFLSQFTSLDITNVDATADVVTGSTFTSESVIRAVKAAIVAVNN